MLGANRFRGPDRLPHLEHILVDQLSLEVQQEPAIREVKVREIASVVHMLVQVRVQYLNEQSHRREVVVHALALREVASHALHQTLETGVGQALIVEDDEERRNQIAHALNVADLQVFPGVCVHNVLELLQVGFGCEVPVVAVAAGDVLVNAVHVEGKVVDQELVRKTKRVVDLNKAKEKLSILNARMTSNIIRRLNEKFKVD